MANRDVILEALQDFCRSNEAPLRAIDPHYLGLLAEVAARAVEGRPVVSGHYAEITMYAAVCGACEARWESDDYAAWTDRGGALAMAQGSGWALQHDGRLLCGDCRSKPGGDQHDDEDDAAAPVGTPAEAEACGRRSGLGEVG